MRFLGFILGIAEANAFSFYKIFSDEGGDMIHGIFRQPGFSFLKYCEGLIDQEQCNEANTPMPLRNSSSKNHEHDSLKKANSNKRRRLAFHSCTENGKSGTRVEHRCSCNPHIYPCAKIVIKPISMMFGKKETN
jgi:hypothetical protein